MVPRNAVVFSEVALGLVPEVLDAVDVSIFARNELFGMINPVVVKAGDIQDVVDAEGVREDHGIRRHLAVDDGQDGFLFGVRDHLGVDLAAALEDTEHRDFAGCATATFAFADAAKIGFVDFDFTIEG